MVEVLPLTPVVALEQGPCSQCGRVRHLELLVVGVGIEQLLQIAAFMRGRLMRRLLRLGTLGQAPAEAGCVVGGVLRCSSIASSAVLKVNREKSTEDTKLSNAPSKAIACFWVMEFAHHLAQF